MPFDQVVRERHRLACSAIGTSQNRSRARRVLGRSSTQLRSGWYSGAKGGGRRVTEDHFGEGLIRATEVGDIRFLVGSGSRRPVARWRCSGEALRRRRVPRGDASASTGVQSRILEARDVRLRSTRELCERGRRPAQLDTSLPNGAAGRIEQCECFPCQHEIRCTWISPCPSAILLNYAPA